MPPAVRVPHHYQDGILYYKIYRHTEGPQVVFLAQTTQQTYLDRSVVWGTKYYYTVSAIHTGGIESLRAEEVSAP
jgi:fibronectin type 3 domain-containing protein